MKKQLLFILMMLLPMVASAQTEIDGVNYYLDSWNKTASVTSNPNRYSGSVVIPEKVTYENVEYSVTSIGGGAFSNCSGLTSVTIPNSVTSIGEGAFSNCSGLTSVTIPNSVTSIGEGAFRYCSGLTSITIPNSVTSIGGDAFWNCSDLTSITIPNSVTSIGGFAFYNCSSLTSITIPSSVMSIGDGAFAACSGLTSVSVENGNTVYDSRDNCNAIIETATNTLLYGCNITIIPNNVTSIENGAFSGCSGLTSITIPNSVTSIGSYAFSNCSGLTSVTIGNSVTSIGNSAFENCSGLTSITIPNNVTDLSRGGGIFEKCTGLKTVIIGSGITRIPQRTFLDCSSLESITCLNPTPPSCYNQRSEYWPFKEFTAILYVPKGSILQYKAADVWRNFVIIREIADEDNDIYLTINDGAKGSVKLKVIDANPFFTLKLEPDNGWQVSSLTLNGENVKAEMTEDGTYTTPAINSNSTLYVVYSQGATSAAALHTDDYQLSAFGNTLTISGTEGGEQISVYSIEGKNVTSLTAKKGTTEIVVNNNQTYIVKVKDQVYKIRM